MGSHLDTAVVPHLAAAYYHFPWDAELRLAYRTFESEARAYGAALEARQQGLFLRPSVLRHRLLRLRPLRRRRRRIRPVRRHRPGGGPRLAVRASGPILSLPFGWDIRSNPASAWLLRTNLRWVPRAGVDLPGTRVDLGGLEFDFMQLVVFPERIFRRK